MYSVLQRKVYDVLYYVARIFNMTEKMVLKIYGLLL